MNSSSQAPIGEARDQRERKIKETETKEEVRATLRGSELAIKGGIQMHQIHIDNSRSFWRSEINAHFTEEEIKVVICFELKSGCSFSG